MWIPWAPTPDPGIQDWVGRERWLQIHLPFQVLRGFRCAPQSENAPCCLLFCFTGAERKVPSQSCLCLPPQKVSFPLSRALKRCPLELGCLEHETTLGAWDLSSRKSPWELRSAVSRTEKGSRPRPELQPKTSTHIYSLTCGRADAELA